MAIAEDAATILDEFVHEVANLPAEIQHLLEEIQAKDELIQACKLQITQKDLSLQRHVKQNGGHVKHPKEEQMVKQVLAKYDEAQALQDEKVALSERACILLDRQVKRLDIKIERLPDSSLFEDRLLPSLLRNSSANLVEAATASRSGIATPVGNFIGSLPTHPPLSSLTNAQGVANAATARLASQNLHAQVQASRTSLGSGGVGLGGAPQAPMASMQSHNHTHINTGGVREGSVGAAEKRRKMQLPNIAMPTSNLARGASAGPGTPKAGTPVSRSGSVGPRIKKTMVTNRRSTMGGAPDPNPLRKKLVSKTGLSKKAARRLKNGNRNSPSTTGGDDSSVDVSNDSDDDRESQRSQAGGNDAENGRGSVAGGNRAEDEEMADGEPYEEEGEDNNLYCICQKPSHGDMIACDNAKCKFEWFHYECVGLKEEPKGKWLCPDCRKLPPNQLKIAK